MKRIHFRMQCDTQHLCLLDSGCRGDLRHEDGDGCSVPGKRGGQGDPRGSRGQDRSRGPPGRGRGGAAVRGGILLSSGKRWWKCCRVLDLDLRKIENQDYWIVSMYFVFSTYLNKARYRYKL